MACTRGRQQAQHAGMSRAPAWHAMAAVAAGWWRGWRAWGAVGGRDGGGGGWGRVRGPGEEKPWGGKAAGGNVRGGRGMMTSGGRGEGCATAGQGVCDRHGEGSAIGGAARVQHRGRHCEVRQPPDELGRGGPAVSSVCCAGPWRHAAQRQGRVIRANLMSRST